MLLCDGDRPYRFVSSPDMTHQFGVNIALWLSRCACIGLHGAILIDKYAPEHRGDSDY